MPWLAPAQPQGNRMEQPLTLLGRLGVAQLQQQSLALLLHGPLHSLLRHRGLGQQGQGLLRRLGARDAGIHLPGSVVQPGQAGARWLRRAGVGVLSPRASPPRRPLGHRPA